MKTGYQVARLLADMAGLVNQELLLQVEYLAAENHILRAYAPARLRLCQTERAALPEIGRRLGRKGLAKVAQVATPETILGWWRKLVAQKFNGSKHRSYPGRPRIDAERTSMPRRSKKPKTEMSVRVYQMGGSEALDVGVNENKSMGSTQEIDWSECQLVELKPGVQSGALVLRGTRMPVNAIVDNFEYGMTAAEIAEQFELPPDHIEAILAYAKSHHVAHLV